MLGAMERHGKPEIFKTDQGPQSTSSVFIGVLKKEKICLNPPNGEVNLYRQVKDYVRFYNTERRHKSIGRLPGLPIADPMRIN